MSVSPKPKADAFEADLRNPRTMRLDGNTIAVMRRDDGSADMVIYHGGLTMALALDPGQAAVMSTALAPPAKIAPRAAADAGSESGGA